MTQKDEKDFRSARTKRHEADGCDDAVPVAATTLSSAALLRTERRRQLAAETVQRDAKRLETLTALRVGLNDESATAFLIVAGRKFGISSAQGSKLVGLDVTKRRTTSKAMVDEALRKLGSSAPFDERLLEKARTTMESPSMTDIESTAYFEVIRPTAAALEQQIVRLQAASTALGADEPLMHWSASTETATNALSLSLEQAGMVSAAAAGFVSGPDRVAWALGSTSNLARELGHLSADASPSISRKAKALLGGADYQSIDAFAKE